MFTVLFCTVLSVNKLMFRNLLPVPEFISKDAGKAFDVVVGNEGGKLLPEKRTRFKRFINLHIFQRFMKIYIEIYQHLLIYLSRFFEFY